MVEFLLGIVVGVVTMFIFLNWYGKKLELRDQKQVGEIIQEHIKANKYAVS
tara:strand:- start:215 stop:367 length:153 start_codon:yes stop_codon:yes gene_type:complete